MDNLAKIINEEIKRFIKEDIHRRQVEGRKPNKPF